MICPEARVKNAYAHDAGDHPYAATCEHECKDHIR